MHRAVALPPESTSAALARRAVEAFAGDIGLDPVGAALVATELVTNAVRHGTAPITLDLRSDGASLTVEVTDCGGGAVRRIPADERRSRQSGGLGLMIVEMLARDWGVRRSPGGGKTVWAEVDG